MRETLSAAGNEITTMAGTAAGEKAVGHCEGVSETGIERVVADKGYHSRDSGRALVEVGVQTIVSEPERGRQNWRGQAAERQAVYANRRRLRSQPARSCYAGEESIWNERARTYTTEAACACICEESRTLPSGLWCMQPHLRIVLGAGTPRRAADRRAAVCLWFLWLVEAERREHQPLTCRIWLRQPLSGFSLT
jgi:hypothetical protein